MTVLERLSGMYRPPVSPQTGSYNPQDNEIDNSPGDVFDNLYSRFQKENPEYFKPIPTPVNAQQTVPAVATNAQATETAQAPNPVDGVNSLSFLSPEQADAVRRGMQFEYNPQQGTFQQFYEATRQRPRQLDERQLNSMRNQAALVDALGLLAQFTSAATGGDLRERKFSETASGQVSGQERNLREYYRKLQDDYDRGLLSATQKDYDIGYRNALANQRFVQQLLNSDINNRARLENSQFNQQRQDERAEYNQQNQNERQAQSIASRERIAQGAQEGATTRTGMTQAGISKRAAASQQAQKEAAGIRRVQSATVAGVTLTPQRAIKGDKENMEAFEAELSTKLPSYVVTSRFRPGATTTAGGASRHATEGGAIDISPSQDKDDSVRTFFNSDEGKLLLFKYGLGFLDETLPENRKWSRGNPAYHIGTDPALVNANNEWVKKNYPDDYLASLPASQIRGTGTGSTTGARTGTGGTAAAKPYKTLQIPSLPDPNDPRLKKDNASDRYYLSYEFATQEEYDRTARTAQDALKDEKIRNQLVLNGVIAWDKKSFTDDDAIGLYFEYVNPSALRSPQRHINIHSDDTPPPDVGDGYESGVQSFQDQPATELQTQQGTASKAASGSSGNKNLSAMEPAATLPYNMSQEEYELAKGYAQEDLAVLNSLSVADVAKRAKDDGLFLSSDKERYINFNKNGEIHSYKLTDKELATAYKEWMSDPLNWLNGEIYGTSGENTDRFADYEID